MFKNKRTSEEEIYSEQRIMQLHRSGIPVVMAKTPVCDQLPEFSTFFGKLRWYRRFP